MTKQSRVRTEVTVLDPLQRYIQEVQRYPFLTAEEELQLAQKMREGDKEAARKLVTAHLRLVVKIAMEYRRSYYNVLDLIQEGNVGLLHAVKKFDPEKGARLAHYASLWIRSYILKFILDNFRLIKIGTTKDQKKLFYNLMREKRNIEAMGMPPDNHLLSERLDVSEAAVEEMGQRLTQPEYALEAPVGSGEAILKDFIAMDEPSVEEKISEREIADILQLKLKEFAGLLNERELKIFQQRLVADLPITLQEIADEYGITKERVRQLEARLLGKLKTYLKEAGLNS